ncbi:MAG: caspase family protein [Candidatus Tectimicrobiota bacterium]
MIDCRIVRVFISSPSDVRPERLIAERVVQRMDREFGYHLRVEPVMWEREPLLASHHFQDLITPPRETDIAVVLLWSRLGMLLPEAQYLGPLSKRPVTGTEWEFEDALASYRERQQPDLLLYRKRTKVTVELGDRALLEEQQRQTELVEDFMRRWTRDAAGKSFTAASWEFADAATFEGLLEGHLRALLRKRLTGPQDTEIPASINWHKGSPYRGLLSFELEHAPVFFGRTRARNEVRELLARQAERGTAFVLVMGASGSGKSSLVRAGVLSDLLLPGMVGRVALCRYAITQPGAIPQATPGDVLIGLTTSLCEPTALPELEALRYTPARLATILREAPGQAALPIEQGLDRARRAAQITERGEARLVLIVDQLEELFTAEGITQEAREQYVVAVESLAQSGLVWVIATLRSDFFERLETLPTLVRLSAGEARYLLTPPEADEVGRIIRQPAREAGLRFEVEAPTGKSLDEVIRQAAVKDTASLPLLEYLLDQLWHRKTATGELTYATYEQLGGLEGAIGRRAEEIFLTQPAEVQAAFPAVLRTLVTVGQGEKAMATARLVPLSVFPEGSPARQLVDALLQPGARILVADGHNQAARVRLAHEALLTHWERACMQTETDRRDLQIRGRLEDAARHWMTRGKEATLLIPRGALWVEADELAKRRFNELDDLCQEYYVQSKTKIVRTRRQVLGGFMLAAVGLGVGGTIGFNAFQQWRSFARERQKQISRADIQGSLVAYSTQAGQEAFDGPRRNGLYTEALLKHIRQKDMGINEVFLRTHQDLLSSPDNNRDEGRGKWQIPEIQNSLTGDVYLFYPPPTRKRFSLVIGVGSYKSKDIQSLKNTLHDAMDISQFLTSVGYEVHTLLDPEHVLVREFFHTFITQLDVLAAIIAEGDMNVPQPSPLTRGILRKQQSRRKIDNSMAFIYISGQGMEIDGKPYLSVTDTLADSKERYLETAIDINYYLGLVKERTSIQILIMDFCRTNPWG